MLEKELQVNNLTEEEKEVAFKILKEYSLNGKSDLYSKLLYSDYAEIPVDIETFLTDDRYLGQAWKDASGKLKIYPFWMDILKEIFPTNVDVNFDTLLESGARGIGKSEIACGAVGAYLMYRVMCLKNPLEFYHLKPTEKICFAFMNIKKELAKEIAISKFQKTIQMSPWFMSKGRMTTFEGDPYWIPPDPVNIIIGSQSDDVIGQPIYYCLDGSTKIRTTDGVEEIQSLVNKDIQVISINSNGEEVISEHCTVKPTLKTDEEYQIELEDGSIIKCTPNHRFMLKDGSYKEAQYLTEEDELFAELDSYEQFIQNIINTRGQWNIPEGEYYEMHHIVPRCMQGKGDYISGGFRVRSNHKNCIWLYPYEHYIAHKLLALENLTNKPLLRAWIMMAFPKGKTKRKFELTPQEYEELRIIQSNIQKGSHLKESTKEKLKAINLGKKLDEATKHKISSRHKGKKLSSDTKNKMSNSAKNRYKERTEHRESWNKGKIAINNGEECRYISKDEQLPEGFVYGQGKHKTYNIKNIEEFKLKASVRSSGSNNGMYNKGYLVSGGKNGHAIYIYTYNGKDYQTRDELINELKKDFPTISENAIRNIQNKTYGIRALKKFKYIIDNLTWRLKKDEN